MTLYSCNLHRNSLGCPISLWLRARSFMSEKKTPCVLLLSVELEARSCVRGRHLFWMKTRWSCAYNKSSVELRPVIQEFLYYSLWNKRYSWFLTSLWGFCIHRHPASSSQMGKIRGISTKKRAQHTLPSNYCPLGYSVVTAFGLGEFNTYMNQI
jgi:hypothetical protein